MNEKSGSNRSLRAAVVGGGIGGISAACCLRRRGVEVMVFEQAKALGEIGAGVLVPPNGLRQLERMGLGKALATVGAKIGAGSRYYRANGTVVGPIVTTDSTGWNGVYGMHRADLLNTLAAELPAEAFVLGIVASEFSRPPPPPGCTSHTATASRPTSLSLPTAYTRLCRGMWSRRDLPNIRAFAPTGV